ncbi:hypothetical protein VTO42DRAFT_6354 [Malbranchea cinnamomea]
MTAKKSQRKRPKLLSHGRPPMAGKPAPSLSSKATRALIRTHHQLQKERSRALADGNEELVRQLDQKIAAHGGIESYQLASKKGQSRDRGGDSSKVLVEWLGPVLKQLKGNDNCLKLLEIGALSTKNACSTVKSIDVTRIDLNSQEPGILQQDFMERPLPSSAADKFHIISLSLVLNYVPDAATRGKMLLRTTNFLTQPMDRPELVEIDLLPCLFLVLPAACVLNSRYFTEDRLQAIMTSVGYSMAKRKVTNKLVYYLWKYDVSSKPGKVEFRKELLNDGRTRNNFTVTLSC